MTTSATAPPALTGVTLSVGDLDAAVSWYAGQFGLTVAAQFALEPYRLRGAVLVSPAGWSIELLERAGSEPRNAVAHPLDAALVRGPAGVQIDVADLESAFAALAGAGATALMPPHPGPTGLSASVADPEGNVIRLHQPGGAPLPPGPPPGAPPA